MFTLKLLKLFQTEHSFAAEAAAAYHIRGNTEHVWDTRWEAL